MSIKKRKSAVSVFFAVSAVISLILVIPELHSYIEFYKAIEQFQTTLNSVIMDTTKMYEGEVLIYVEFTITNPTGFAGLKISSMTYHLKYIKGGSLQSLTGMTQTFSSLIQINPTVGTKLPLDLVLKYKGQESQIRDFIGYLQTNPEKIDWVITGQLVIHAYKTPLAVPIGPFQHSTYLH